MSKSKSNNRGGLVYSTTQGQMCPGCGNPINSCTCKKQEATPKKDGIVRIRREVKGRGGKTVTTITDVPLHKAGLFDLATELKRHCGTGGSVKNGIIIIQGDFRTKLVELIKKKGYTVKLSGG